MASRILLEKHGNSLTLHAPDHPTLDAQAPSLDGKRKGGSWTFPLSKEAAVHKLARELFGTTGDDGGAKVTLRVDLSLFGEGSVGHEGEAWLAGRLLARRPAHDARVQLGDGVKLVRGGFGVWGGARNHPALDARYGTVVDVEGVPRTAAELACQKYPITTAIVAPKVEAVVGAWSKTVVTRDVTTKPAAVKSAASKKVKSKMHSESTMPPPAPMSTPPAAKPAPAAKAKPAPAAKAKAKPAPKAKPKAKAKAKPKAKTMKAKATAAAKSVRKAVKAKAPKARAAAKSAAKTVRSKARAAAKTVKAKAPKAMAAVSKATSSFMARAKAAAKKAGAKVRKAVAKAKAKSATKKKATKKKATRR